MLNGSMCGVEVGGAGAYTWSIPRAPRAAERRGNEVWRDVDRRLRSIATRRAALDHEELVLIRRAIAVQLWRPLGMVSMREYLERIMGYGPHAASERLRVATALEGLPATEAALASGDLSYSAVRELTRIATRKTDEAWVAAARGKNLRQIEELVAEREPGDPPTSKPKPDLRPRSVTVKLRPAEQALLREARLRLESERGERLDDGELVAEMCARVLGGAPEGKRVPKPRHQIAITVCKTCKQGWQRGGGVQIAITPEELATACCDAEWIGSLDGSPEGSTASIPTKTRKLVWHRDGGRCQVPGCRAAQNLDVHHIVAREHGGGHEPENLTVLCAGHHRALHDGALTIAGAAPDIEVTQRWEVPKAGPPPSHVDESEPHVKEPEQAELESQVERASAIANDSRLALQTLGFTKAEAAYAVECALATIEEPDLEALIRGALRECRKLIH